METEPVPVDPTIPCDAAARGPDELPRRAGDLRREHWVVPVHSLNTTAPDGTAQAIARPDGTMILQVNCGRSQITVRLDVSRAAQLSTGIWEAAGIAQQLTHRPDHNQFRAAPALRDESEARHLHSHRNVLPSKPRRVPGPANNGVSETARTIGRQIRRIRGARRKSLRVIAGLAGMSRSTLHRIERGEREITLPEIVALAGALQTAATNLIRLPGREPVSPGADRPAAG